MSNHKIKLEKALKEIDIKLSELQTTQFIDYYDMIIEWNNVMNLTTITEFDEVVIKHFVDSLSIIKFVDMNQVGSVIDIGTGAGFPGIPLKILFPNLRITLLDSVNKKIEFLEAVINNLNLSNITAIHGRAEDIAQRVDHRESYDLAVSRAVAQLNTLAEYAMPFVKVGGKFVSYKSGEIQQELQESENAINVFGGTIEKVEQFVISKTDINRSFVIVNKNSVTPIKYPRKAGKPSSKPIM